MVYIKLHAKEHIKVTPFVQELVMDLLFCFINPLLNIIN